MPERLVFRIPVLILECKRMDEGKLKMVARYNDRFGSLARIFYLVGIVRY